MSLTADRVEEFASVGLWAAEGLTADQVEEFASVGLRAIEGD